MRLRSTLYHFRTRQVLYCLQRWRISQEPKAVWSRPCELCSTQAVSCLWPSKLKLWTKGRLSMCSCTDQRYFGRGSGTVSSAHADQVRFMFCLLAGHRGWLQRCQKDRSTKVNSLTCHLQASDLLLSECASFYLELFSWWPSGWWVSHTLQPQRPTGWPRHHSTLSSCVPCCGRGKAEVCVLAV